MAHERPEPDPPLDDSGDCVPLSLPPRWVRDNPCADIPPPRLLPRPVFGRGCTIDITIIDDPVLPPGTWQWTPHSDLPAQTEIPEQPVLNHAETLAVFTAVLNCLPPTHDFCKRVEAGREATRLLREIEATHHAGMNWRQALANLRWLLCQGMPSAKVDARKLITLGSGVKGQ